MDSRSIDDAKPETRKISSQDAVDDDDNNTPETNDNLLENEFVVEGENDNHDDNVTTGANNHINSDEFVIESEEENAQQTKGNF